MKNRIWMNKAQAAIIAAALGTVVTVASAGTSFGQEVIFTGEKASVTVYQTYSDTSSEAEPDAVMTVDVERMHILGGVSAGPDTVLYAPVLIPNEDMGDGEGEMPWITGFVLSSEIMEKVPALSFTELPTAFGWTDLRQGSSGDLVMAAQNCLIDLGFLDGAADGIYGSGTAGAVSAFQQEKGLPATGVLDVITYFYLEECAEEPEALEVSYPPVYTVEDKFDDIMDDMEDASVLEAFVTPEWRYEFDSFEGEGLITEGTVLGTFEDTSRPVDTISLTVSPAMKVERKDTGLISVYPILQVKSIGAYRPYVKGIILKAGNDVCELGDAVLSGNLVGTQVEEMAEVQVSAEDLKALEDSADKTLEIRVLGNSRTYDLAVNAGVQELVELVKEME